ncbi:MAG TPA: DJ-1/PfpI family protein [Thermoanaerobaculia bacterium]|nr:DJ-1/PfpI family protein [Thermoanaerobaculia bacterium]
MATTMRVGMVLYDGCTLLDFAGATQVFAFAPGFEVVWLAPEMRPITTTENVQVLPHCTFGDAGALDVVFVPGGGEKVGTVMQDSVYVDFVRTAGRQAKMAGSICTGAFIVAAAGLFDGYEVSTYWSQRENLALFPNLRVSAGYPRWVIHGNRFSGGGISSSIDMALEIVSMISGPTQSMTTQLSIQYAPDPPFHSGDPAQAPPEVTAAVLKSQESFTAAIEAGVEAVLGGD